MAPDQPYWLEIVNVSGNVNVSASNVGLSATRKFTVALPASTFVPEAKVISVPAVEPESACHELLGVTPLPEAVAEYSKALTDGAVLPEVPAVALLLADWTVIFALGEPLFGTRTE